MMGDVLHGLYLGAEQQIRDAVQETVPVKGVVENHNEKPSPDSVVCRIGGT